MNIKQITNNLQDQIYNDENLSLPFILEHNGKEKLAYFVFSCSDSDDVLEITSILKVIVVDYDTTDVTYLKGLPNLNYPISISFDSPIPIDDLDVLYERYYNNIEKYLSKKSSIEGYCEVADKVLSNDFKKLYKNLGAKFI